MFKDSKAFSGFSVDDSARAKQFYNEILGLEVTPVNGMEELHMYELHTAGNHPILMYPKSDHQPATFTILNFPVPDIDQAVAELTDKGVSFEDIPGMEQDESLILRGKQAGMGPDIAWFKDPAGNTLSVIQE
jgi:predicted enzyme related to lactoylglutathione lyase